MSGIWEGIVEFHRGLGWQNIVMLYGPALAVLLLLIILLAVVRTRRAVRAAMRSMEAAGAEVKAAMRQIDELERRLERRLDARAGDLDARMTKKMDHKGDLIQERIDERSAALSESINRLESRVSRGGQAIEQFRVQVREVEGRIPGLFDKLEDFRDTLAKTFQVELGSVLNSFDNSVGAILHQMKAEMQMGISRIEGIEGMVQSRRAAGRTLLGAPDRAGIVARLPGSEDDEDADDENDDEDFAEWEDEAKHLAEEDDGDGDEPDEGDEGGDGPGEADADDDRDPDEGIRSVHVEREARAADDEEYTDEIGRLTDEDLFAEGED